MTHICKQCGSELSIVVNTEETQKTVRRRRQCKRCRYQWTTWEIDDEVQVTLSLLQLAAERAEKLTVVVESVIEQLEMRSPVKAMAAREIRQMLKPMTKQEVGRTGGTKTREEYGLEHFKKIGRLGGLAVAEDRERMRELGRRGGKARVAKMRAAQEAKDADPS